MPTIKYVIELSDEDQAELIDIVTKGRSPARTILRANILLASDRRSEKYMAVFYIVLDQGDNMIKEQRMFLTIMDNYLHGEPSVLCDNVDYSILSDYADKHEVNAILDRQCGKQLPVEMVAALKPKVAAGIFSYANREKNRKQLESAFREKGLEYFIVKGPMIAQYYPNPMDRSMGDIDFTMRDRDREIAAFIMEEQGFTCAAKSFYEWQYFKKEHEIELHNAMVYEENINKPELTAYFNDFWKYVNNGQLDWNFHFLYIILHLRKHFMNVGVGLRQFFDIAVLCHRKKDFDWNWIHGELTKLGLNRFAETVFVLIMCGLMYCHRGKLNRLKKNL